MDTMKKVSVIVPVYNVEKYLTRCLDSIVGQTYKNLEIICVNDGSPDNSAEILVRYAKKDERIILISQENQGLSGARNAGLEVATGEYTVFVDSDDWIEYNTIETAVNAAENDKVEMVMWTYVREFRSHSEKKTIFEGNRVFDKYETATFVHRRMAGLLDDELAVPENSDALCTAWGKLYMTEKIKKNNIEFIDTKIIGTEDVLFNLEYFAYVESCEFLDIPLNHYRKDNEASLTKSYKPMLFKQWSTLYEMMFRYIRTHRLQNSEEFENAVYNRVCLSMIGLGLNEYCRRAKFMERAVKISEILNSPMYREAYSRLDLSHFPPHWKAFFHYCKMGSATRTTLVIGVINVIINRKNKETK